jgi:hypothetical protein
MTDAYAQSGNFEIPSKINPILKSKIIQWAAQAQYKIVTENKAVRRGKTLLM